MFASFDAGGDFASADAKYPHTLRVKQKPGGQLARPVGVTKEMA
jgi:hypothetical protein